MGMEGNRTRLECSVVKESELRPMMLLALAWISGSFIFLYPINNDACHKGVTDYQKYLVNDDEEQTNFQPRDLNHFIRALRDIHNVVWTQ